MSRRSDKQVVRAGVYAVVIAVLLMAAALNLQKFPGFKGTAYKAEFADASGLHKGNMVQVAGIRVGRVKKIDLAGDHVVVHFGLDPGVKFGTDSEASVEVLNLLGEKFMDLKPKGPGQMRAESTIPLSRTDASYDIVRVFNDLSDTTEKINIPQLQEALNVVADTMDSSSTEAKAAFDGLSRVSESIASRDTELQELLDNAANVAQLLSERKGDVVALVKQGDLILGELRNRSEAIHTLLLNTGILAQQLGGLVDDNEKQLKPMLAQLHQVTQLLVQRQEAIRETLKNVGPYVNILSNIVGTGPWFDAFAVNILGVFTGEFVPGE